MGENISFKDVGYTVDGRVIQEGDAGWKHCLERRVFSKDSGGYVLVMELIRKSELV